MQLYEVIVIGGGHAGTEAALASARLGAKTLLLTQNIETLGQMSCNPSIGGIGKGHLVKEIDALGGVMARAIDQAGIQFRRLNASKGPAVRATRAQADRVLYKQAIRQALEASSNLDIFQQTVTDLIVEQGQACGVITQMGLSFRANTVVLTVGTFLGGRIFVGFGQHAGGRAGDPPSIALAKRLREMPFSVGRLKTGTPPRIDGRTVDFTQCTPQPGDEPTPVFSFLGDISDHPPQVPCYIGHTNERTHTIIREAFDRSPLFTGVIEGAGPRYCPSIEDKVARFPEKTSHQIFIEPEGLTTTELYPNGISTSLPFDVQQAFVRSMKGFEQAHITRPGYAIEYDFFDPRGLHPTLETKPMPNLFFAGQINGTTGYEEAAAQGLIAGLNAALNAQSKEPWYPRRDEAYIGVMIDDLITTGTKEPYRMFTSRAEYRLMLREDNADARLTPIGYRLGLVDQKRMDVFEQKREAIEKETARLKSCWIQPGSVDAKILESEQHSPIEREYNALSLLARPQVDYALLTRLPVVGAGIADGHVCEQIEIEQQYAGYIKRQQLEVERQARHQSTRLPDTIDYNQIKSLSAEVRQKLSQVRPTTIGQASRIPGLTPAAISILLVALKKK